MYERLHVSVKVEPRSTSRLLSTIYFLPLFYLCVYNLRALTCGAKNASVEIHLKLNSVCILQYAIFSVIVFILMPFRPVSTVH